MPNFLTYVLWKMLGPQRSEGWVFLRTTLALDQHNWKPHRQLQSRAGLQQNGKIKGNQNYGSQSLFAACLTLSRPTLRHPESISPSPTITILKRVIYNSFPQRHRRSVKPGALPLQGGSYNLAGSPRGQRSSDEMKEAGGRSLGDGGSTLMWDGSIMEC